MLSADILLSIDAVCEHVLAAVQLLRSGRIDSALRRCQSGAAILATIVSYQYFREFPNRIIHTCSESLEAAATKCLDLLVGQCRKEKTQQLSFASEKAPESALSEPYAVPTHHDLAVTFDAIMGNDHAKLALMESVVLPLTLNSRMVSKVFQGVRAGTGNVLLHGPPGCGKTCLAQAAAREAGACFFSVRPSDVLSKYQGESERYLSNLFVKARQQHRAIIFFDEFDCIAVTRGCSEEGIQCRRLLSELLLQLTHQQQHTARHRKSFGDVTHADKEKNVNVLNITQDSGRKSPEGRVVVIAATNRIQDMDEAVLRRFDTKVFVDLPDDRARTDLVGLHLAEISHQLTERDLRTIADEMVFGWSGSEIEILCREAAMRPLRELMSAPRDAGEGSSSNGVERTSLPPSLSTISDIRPVTMEDFENALKHLLTQQDRDDATAT